MTLPDPDKVHPAVIVLVHQDGRILMQLRDNRPDIVYPDCWGYFGGGIKPGESCRESALREIYEELNWRPATVTQLHEALLIIPGKVRLTTFAAPLDGHFEVLRLQEGADMGLFSLDQIRGGRLYSKMTGRNHAVIPHPFMIEAAARLMAHLVEAV